MLSGSSRATAKLGRAGTSRASSGSSARTLSTSPIDEIVEGQQALRLYVEKEEQAQGPVEVRMGTPLIEEDRVMAEFWVVAADDASIAGCLIAHLDEAGICNYFREYWFDLEGARDPFDGWGT